ncbi:hypothetical protein LTR82_005239 [Friedmanniomyces endolithicus]|uniref:Uncharacterized protein n=1 Tax=Friedmanniomyces endolithicus TaxID=329885 RepID=A0AAN6JAN4_9PEZI|nr:hypothetical protein LTR82_005239 [Friedmanniomyces endolithicus]
MPLKLRLILETGERDPVARESASYQGPDWWCSDSEDEEDCLPANGVDQRTSWAMREVEMVARTRAIGTSVSPETALVSATKHATEYDAAVPVAASVLRSRPSVSMDAFSKCPSRDRA